MNALELPDHPDLKVNFDSALRPNLLDDYVGQEAIKKNLRLTIQAAKEREESLDHLLLSGPPGLGKTTLARIVATEMNVPIRITSGPALERSGDLASILATLQPHEVLFIDEIHRLNRTIEEMLYPVMEDWSLDLVLGKGPAARTMRLDIPPFTLVGATTRPGHLSAPLRDRFGLQYHLDYYTPEDMAKIVARSAHLLNLSINPEAIAHLASRTRSTPRIANRLIKRVRDYAQVHNPDHAVDRTTVEVALEDLGIDALGLDGVDRRLLTTIIENFQGGPVGAETLAAALSVERATLEDVYEPYLMQIGFLQRTSRGRKATPHAANHLGLSLPMV